MRRSVVLAAVIALLLVPAVQATEGHGELVTERPGEIHGPGNVTADEMTLVHATDEPGTLTLEGRFTVTHNSTRHYQNGSQESETRTRTYTDARLVVDNGSIVTARLAAAARLDAEPDGYGADGAPSAVILPDGPGILETSVSGETDTSSPRTAQARGSDRQQRSTEVDVRAFELGNLTIGALDPVRHDGAAEILVLPGRARVEHADGTDVFESGFHQEQRTVCDRELNDECIMSHEERVLVVNRTRVTTDGAALEAAASASPETTRVDIQPKTGGDGEDPVRFTGLYADRFEMSVNATFKLDDATGRIVVGDETYDVDGETVEVGGVLDARIEPVDTDRDGASPYRLGFDGDVRYVKAPTPRTFPPAVTAGAALGAGILAAAVVYLWPALKFAGTKMLVVAGYTQVEDDEILDNDTRATIFQAIHDDPGLSASDLADRADCGWGTVVYHLAVLEDSGKVVSTRDGRHRRFFPYEGMDFRHRDVFSAIRNETTAAILNAVRDAPGIHQKQLREEVGVAASTVNWHISKLEDAGLVEKERDGRKVRYQPGPKADLVSDEDLDVAG